MATASLIPVTCNPLSPSSLKGENFLCNTCPSKPSFGCQSTSKLERLKCKALQDTKEKGNTSSAEETTEKFGLEAGLWKIFSSKEEGQEERKQKSKTDQAKELLAKYGGAYLATSISLSIVSFTLCYLLISAGVDVAALLQKVGITANETGEKVGTFALAYAAHKASSPIRFPPTVALTPLVASWIGGKKGKKQDE
ncbi:uncharacterized protein [Aristolochia californica]|uniref:uncharacterized protein n=1 Tax=Aristolochia californica TaxID=171875 RepID=UPI0035E1178E